MNPIYTSYGLTQWLWLVRHRENFKLGKNTQIASGVIIGCEHGVEIQDNVKIGYHAVIMSHSSIDDQQGKIILKKNCKIGAHSVIAGGVTIGENSILGACSYAKINVPNNEVWGGVPAKFIKNIKNENKQ